jgi:hypothetical protein
LTEKVKLSIILVVNKLATLMILPKVVPVQYILF